MKALNDGAQNEGVEWWRGSSRALVAGKRTRNAGVARRDYADADADADHRPEHIRARLRV
jgi:hypothetical protein